MYLSIPSADTRFCGAWQVLESRVDHTRVVLMLRKAGNLPLVKDYLIAVQKTNLSAVNEAVNELLIEEEDFEVCNIHSPPPPTKHLLYVCF